MRHKDRLHQKDMWRWIGVVFAGYVFALWSNAVLRWFDMILIEGTTFLSSRIRLFGFLNAMVFMSMAVVFVIIGAYFFNNMKLNSTTKWLGLAFSIVGLHYIVYIIYSYFVNAISFTLLIDIWTIPFLGLGMALLRKSTRTDALLRS